MQSSRYLYIMADETTDKANTTQLVIVFRYVINREIRERFWGFFYLTSTDPVGISGAILNQLETVIPAQNANKLICQTYDGAAVMKGQRNGVQTKIQEKNTVAHFIVLPLN